jgi:LacI family transcriptional regulator
MPKITIKEIARQLNLSTATISRALRDSHEISVETKQKVFALAEALNYRPNPFASSLREQKSKTIAVILPDITDNFFSLAINGIDSIASQHHHHVLIYLTHDSIKKQTEFIQILSGGRVDGILISLAKQTENYTFVDELIQHNIPVVFFDRVPQGANYHKITTNDYASSYAAVQHLIQENCTKIAFLSGLHDSFIGNERLKGYQNALLDNKIDFDKNLIFYSNNNDTSQDMEALAVFMQQQQPDGILASVERLGKLTYLVCDAHGHAIPEAIKVISFANLDTASILKPSLTTITQPAYEIGKVAAELLFQILNKKNNGKEPTSQILESQLITRNSSKNQDN